MQFYANFHFCDQLLEHCSKNSNARGLWFGIHLRLIQKHIFNFLIWLVETQNWFVGIVGQLFGNCILFCHKILKWEKLPRIFTISKWAHQNKLTFLWRNWVHIFPVHRIKCLIGFDFHVESFSSFPSMQTYNIIQKNLVCKVWKDIVLLSTGREKAPPCRFGRHRHPSYVREAVIYVLAEFVR